MGEARAKRAVVGARPARAAEGWTDTLGYLARRYGRASQPGPSGFGCGGWGVELWVTVGMVWIPRPDEVAERRAEHRAALAEAFDVPLAAVRPALSVRAALDRLLRPRYLSADEALVLAVRGRPWPLGAAVRPEGPAVPAGEG